MRIAFPAVALLLLGAAYSNAAGSYALWLSCHPRAIVADSHSYATITAEARDPSGRAVPDGSLVEFTTSLGEIERQARTTAGVARVRLESGSAPGTALVSAVLVDGGVVAQIRVDFLEPGTKVLEESFIGISSPKFLAYDVDRRLVDAVGGVTIYHRGMTIKAEDAQIDLNRNLIRARARIGGAPILIERGDKSLLAEALCYDFDSMHGTLITPPETGAKRYSFRGRDLFAEPERVMEQDEKLSQTHAFEFLPITESKLLIRCSSMIIRPGVEIKFKRASYYVDGDRLVTVPLHVVSLRGEASGVEQMLAYGTEGVRLNLPIYYSLTPTSTGAIRVRHSEPTGWGYYSDREGWQVDIDHDYDLSGSIEGRFSVNRVTSKEWGVRWNQRAELGPDSQLYTYLDFPARRDLYTTLDYSRRMSRYNWTTTFRSNKLRGFSSSFAAHTYLQSHFRPLIGDSVAYSVTTKLSYDSGSYENRGKLGQGLDIQLYGKPITIGRRAMINTSASVSRNWGGANPGSSVFANVSMLHNIASRGTLAFNYSYSWADTSYGYNSQRLSANFNFVPSLGWGTNVYAVYGLNDRSMSLFGQVTCTFNRDWRFSFLFTRQNLQYSEFSDFEIALSRILGRQEAILAWSQSRKRFRFEFAAASF